MKTGQIISGAGHIGLIGWALLGGVFSSEPLPFEVTEVTTISNEEYAALFAGSEAPEAVAEIASPEPPEPPEDLPELTSAADAAPELSEPEAAEAPPADDTPDLSDFTPPQAEVSDEPPVLEAPSEETALLLPQTDIRPKPRPVPRVAPTPVAPPEPDVKVDDVVREETQPDEAAGAPKEETEATAPEEAATEIVTEAEEPASVAPSRSLRPVSRPSRPAPKPAVQPDEKPGEARDAVAQALAEAMGGDDSPTPRAAPSGPPLTGGEKDALRVAVQECWNVGSLSSDAMRTTVVVAVGMTETGMPIAGSIKMLSYSGGSEVAANQAYAAARRAIIRCGARGYNLPTEKYDHWRDIEMTFNPEKMRIK